MKNLLTILSSLLLTACLTNQSGDQELDLTKLHKQLDAVEVSLGDLAVIAESQGYSYASSLKDLYVVASSIDAEIERLIAEGGSGVSLIPTLDMFMNVATTLIANSPDNPDLQFALLGAKAIVNQIRLAIE